MEGMTNSKQCVLRGPNAAQEPSARSRPNAKRSVTFDLPPLLLDDDEGCGTGPNTPMEHPEVAGTDVNSFTNNNTLLQAAFATSVGTTLQTNATSATPSFVDPAVNADVLHALFTLVQRDARLGSQLPVITFTKRHQHLLEDIRSIVVPSLSDYEMLGTVGSGFHGDVSLVEDLATGDQYALKSISKREVVATPQIAQYMVERDIMVSSSSPWLPSAHATFQDQERLYIVADFFPRGDLYQHLCVSGDIFAEDTARFYLAELAEAIHTLHTMGYVHRDIKPDNVLVEESGHIVLADFGSAAKISELIHASGMAKAVGTPDYIAPEVLDHAFSAGAPTYGSGCDWWSFGVAAFEMLFGWMPFSDGSCEAVTFNNIMRFETNLAFPTTDDHNVSTEGIDFIRGLLCAPEKRFGYKEIRAHPFFRGVRWETLRSQQAPVLPDRTTVTPVTANGPFKDVSHLTVCSEVQQLQFVGFSSALKQSIPEESRRGSLTTDLKLELDAVRKANEANTEVLTRQLRVAEERIIFLEKKVKALTTDVEVAQKHPALAKLPIPLARLRSSKVPVAQARCVRTSTADASVPTTVGSRINLAGVEEEYIIVGQTLSEVDDHNAASEYIELTEEEEEEEIEKSRGTIPSSLPTVPPTMSAGIATTQIEMDTTATAVSVSVAGLAFAKESLEVVAVEIETMPFSVPAEVCEQTTAVPGTGATAVDTEGTETDGGADTVMLLGIDTAEKSTADAQAVAWKQFMETVPGSPTSVNQLQAEDGCLDEEKWGNASAPRSSPQGNSLQIDKTEMLAADSTGDDDDGLGKSVEYRVVGDDNIKGDSHMAVDVAEQWKNGSRSGSCDQNIRSPLGVSDDLWDVSSMGSSLEMVDVRIVQALRRTRPARPSIFSVFGEQVHLAPVYEERADVSVAGCSLDLSDLDSEPSSDSDPSSDGDGNAIDESAPFDCEGTRFGMVSALIRRHSSASTVSKSAIERHSSTSSSGISETDVEEWTRAVVKCGTSTF